MGQAFQVILDVRGAFAAAALIQPNSPEPGRIMEFLVAAAAQGTSWSAVKVKDGHPGRTSGGLPVDPGVRHVNIAAVRLIRLGDHFSTLFDENGILWKILRGAANDSVPQIGT